jgi:hypothetical protein
MDAPIRAAFLAEPTRASAQAQGFVITTQEYLDLQFDHNSCRTDIHALAVDQEGLGVAVQDFSELLVGRRMGRTTMASVVVRTTKLTLETYPGSGHDASGFNRLRLDGSQFAGTADEAVKIDRISTARSLPSLGPRFPPR